MRSANTDGQESVPSGHKDATEKALSGPLNRIDGVVYATAEQAAFYFDCDAWERCTLMERLLPCRMKYMEKKPALS